MEYSFSEMHNIFRIYYPAYRIYMYSNQFTAFIKIAALKYEYFKPIADSNVVIISAIQFC
jgi:hypothetical protein